MIFSIPYFSWLQRGNPTGRVDTFPELAGGFETSVPGIYCIGDLTGVPLINLAADSGRRIIAQLTTDPSFQAARKNQKTDGVHDLVIIGAGPAGISAAIEARRARLDVVVLEAVQPFNTIRNFPARKPIHIQDAPEASSPFSFQGDLKETLLDELLAHPALRDLPIVEGASVETIAQRRDHFVVRAGNEEYRALRVIVAIGKTGNPKRLDVPGERRAKVYARLIDASEFSNKDILVVGGGDSALEAAVGLAEAGNRVTLSYRGDRLTRPKPANVNALLALERAGQVTVLLSSTVTEIAEKSVTLTTREGTTTLQNDVVFTLIGAEIPIAFFKRAGIRMENERRRYDHLVLWALLLFSVLLYFGKSASPTPIASLSELWSLPAVISAMPFDKMLKALLAWAAFIGLFPISVLVLVEQLRNRRAIFSGRWRAFKWAYFTFSLLLFMGLYVYHNLLGERLLGLSTGGWYTAMYSLTILVFGIRRMTVHPTPYIRKQTLSLILIQLIPLFLLPVFILPALGKGGLLPDWVMTHVFPGGAYWRAFGIILAWPLFLYNLASGQPYLFWLVFSIVQTFVIIPYIVYRWGKGAYCGFICSCGALAETLGDEHRTKAPHGPEAKRWENAGQIVLLFALVVTAFALLRTWAGISLPGAGVFAKTYAIVVDIVFAGVLGVGVYFTFSGRIWCRFLCPLAALMHIYARFTRYRIFAKKRRCISCGICTRVCHMGIDVMGFAARGIPMNDVECVRCSACVIHCPMDVLSFGAQPRADLDNTLYLKADRSHDCRQPHIRATMNRP